MSQVWPNFKYRSDKCVIKPVHRNDPREFD